MTCPRPQKSLGQSRTRNWVSTCERLLFWVTAPCPTRWRLLCGPRCPERARQPRSFGPGQDEAKRVGPDGSRISPGSGARPLPPYGGGGGRCLRGGRAGPPGGAERPPLPHASRTNKTLRSGLCEGLVAGRERRARGLAVALGDLLVLVFRARSAARRPPPPHLRASAADTSAARGRHRCAPGPPLPPGPPSTQSALLGLVPSARPGACAEARRSALLYGLFSPRP